MPTPADKGPVNQAFKEWFAQLRTSDPALFADLSRRLAERNLASGFEGALPTESALEGGFQPVPLVGLETIVMEGRPAFLIKDAHMVDDPALVDAASAPVTTRLREALPRLEPIIPLVGRIDVANFPGPVTFVGTGWLVAPELVVTNRHVADLISIGGEGDWRFRPGALGDPIGVSIDYRHESGSESQDTFKISRVVWIERDSTKADIAFLEVARRPDGARQTHVELAEADADPTTHVAAIGYPAKAPAHIIPDQDWMNRIYRNTYDVKRIAPGQARTNDRGWATHDCTTLGGNSGSVVVDMATGKAVALHFAGIYMVRNYAVPASTIKAYLKDPPWQHAAKRPEAVPAAPPAAAAQGSAPVPAEQPPVSAAGGGIRIDTVQMPQGVSITLPLTITLSFGAPAVSAWVAAAPRLSVTEAVAEFAAEHGGDGVLAVRPGYAIENETFSDTPCIAVSAHPDRVAALQGALPLSFAGHPVVVRVAPLADQLGPPGGFESEAALSISYDNDHRRGEAFSFEPVEETMAVTCHVGPERSWEELSTFLDNARSELVSSIYEFHAAHVAAAVENRLAAGVAMKLVMAPQSRDHAGATPRGDFPRRSTFADWASRFGQRFERIIVPTGRAGLVASAYHIKVTVRDGDTVWLSSGNWKRPSQPVIARADRDNPRVTGAAGNREWHVVIANVALARRFRSHILADLARSQVLGGTLEAVDDEPMVDVPDALAETFEPEAMPDKVVEPRRFERRIRVRPLLTPDRQGEVYVEPVLELIRSARKQLLMQNQYISIRPENRGLFERLVAALIDRSRAIADVRIILRSEGDGFLEDAQELKRRGLDVTRCLRRLPSTHTKGIVVDGARVLIGSHNWSALGVTLNRDASLIFEDDEIARYYADVFEIDWARAPPLRLREPKPETAPRVATAAPPAPGFSRRPLSAVVHT